MSNNATKKQDAREPHEQPPANDDNHPFRVVACVGASPASAAVIPHAGAISHALGGVLCLVHVIEPGGALTPQDPVAWDIRKREANLYVLEMANRFEAAATIADTQILEGRISDRIGEYSDGRTGGITALCRCETAASGRLGETTRRVLEATGGSLLVVPAAAETQHAQYRRLMVPLDGSPRAENALPIAVRIAADQGAELVLVHATPKVDFIHGGPPDVQDIELQNRLARRGRRAAGDYLARVRESLSGSGVSVDTVILEEGDVRRRLVEAVSSQAADLLVISSHGQSGLTDVPAGHVSHYMLTHVGIPVLMVRRPRPAGVQSIYSDVQSKGVRRPHENSV